MTIIRYYADVMQGGYVRACLDVTDPDEGPPMLPPHAQGTPVLLDGPISWAGPTETSQLYYVDGAQQWREAAKLPELKAAKAAEITAARLAADADHFIYTYTYTGADGNPVTDSKAIKTADKDMIDLIVSNARIEKCAPDTMPANWVGGWKAMNDTGYVRIGTRAEWDTFFIAMYDAGIGNFMHAEYLRAQLEQATTADQVAAISW